MLSKWKKCDKYAKHKSMYRSNVINLKIAFQESFLLGKLPPSLEPMAKWKLRDKSIYNQLRLPQNYCPRMKNQCQFRWITLSQFSAVFEHLYAIYAKLVCLNSMFSLIVYACVNQTGIVRTHPQRKLKLSKYIYAQQYQYLFATCFNSVLHPFAHFGNKTKIRFLNDFFIFAFLPLFIILRVSSNMMENIWNLSHEI